MAFFGQIVKGREGEWVIRAADAAHAGVGADGAPDESKGGFNGFCVVCSLDPVQRRDWP